MGGLVQSERLYGGSMPPGARDEIIEWAARCEGWDAAMRGGADGAGRALRVPWHETTLMSAGATRSVAHMSLTLHEEYDFTDACATDGSFIKATADERSRASYGWWRGVRADGSADGDGGALLIGGNVQDAEMLGIAECMATAGERAEATQGLAAPRLLVISDCMAVLIAIERAWRGGSAWRLAGHGRAAMCSSGCC